MSTEPEKQEVQQDEKPAEPVASGNVRIEVPLGTMTAKVVE